MDPFANWRGHVRFPCHRRAAGSRSDGPIGGTGKENIYPETTSDDPDPPSLSLPPSPPCPPSLLVELVDPVQPPDEPQEVGPCLGHDDPPLSDDWSVTSSSGRHRLPATTDITLTTPPTDRTVRPPLVQLPPSSAPAAPGPDRDEDKEILEPHIPPLTPPTTSSPPRTRASRTSSSQCLPGGYQKTYQATLTCIFRPTSCRLGEYILLRRDQ